MPGTNEGLPMNWITWYEPYNPVTANDNVAEGNVIVVVGAL